MTAKEKKDLDFQEKLEEIARRHGADYQSREPGDLEREIIEQGREIRETGARVDALAGRVSRLEKKDRESNRRDI